MQSNEWIELFRLIPPGQHNQLVLVTNNRIELNIEILLRLDPGCIIFRGRVSGQNDDGRLFFLPYDQITFVNVNRFVNEDELREILGPINMPGSEREHIAEPDPAPAESSPSLAMPADLLAALAPQLAAPGSSQMTRPRQAPTPMIAPPAPVVAAPRQTIAPPAPPPAAEPTNGKSSILERLRAQRNALKGAKK